MYLFLVSMILAGKKLLLNANSVFLYKNNEYYKGNSIFAFMDSEYHESREFITMGGNPVPKADGSGYWNHLKELQDTLNGLRNHANTLKDVNNPTAQAARQKALEAIE